VNAADYPLAVDPVEREWWRRAVGVLARPRPVFAALRSEQAEDVEARQEPILAIVLLAGIAGVLATPVAGRLYDEPAVDGLFIAIWAFIAGGVYGVAGYFLLGAALWLALRSLGSEGRFRRARHLLAFALVPIVLSLGLLPVELAVYGGDVFGSNGSDEGTGTAVFELLRLVFLLWAAGLLVVGVRELERWSWPRAAGTIGLLSLFTAAFLAVPTMLS
jgi:hypothetical protein